MKKTLLRGALTGALLALAAPSLAACSSHVVCVVESAAVVSAGSHVAGSTFAAAAVAEGVTIVDVRTPAEYAEGHLPGAVNIDVSGPAFVGEIAPLDPQGKYAVYCRSGHRSRAAIDAMEGAGFSALIGLEGGIGAWSGEVVVD